MQTGVYSFHCRFETPASLPVFKGSTLRGAFGHALKMIACTLRRQSCDACLLEGNCVYANIFNFKKAAGGRQAGLPLPYVLEPPLEKKRTYRPGDFIDFNMILFGRVNEYLPYIVYAVERMGENGLGAGAKKGQGKFSLLAICLDGKKIYCGEKKTLDRSAEVRNLKLDVPSPGCAPSVSVTFKSPFRVKFRNQFQEKDLPFHVLIRTALRRVSALEAEYGEGEPPLDYPMLIKKAEQVVAEESRIHWQDLERYSSRQKTGMMIGGLKGDIVYQGNLDYFLPLLRYCEVTHLGKQTSFGLGKIAVSCTGDP